MGSERLERALARMDRLVDWERRDRSAGMRRGLEPIRALLARLGHPERAFRAVHVAGTKGKGSTSALVAAGLERAGLATGLYTSPHVETVHERVVVGGVPVGDDALAGALERALAAREAGLEAPDGPDSTREVTWFDLMTAAAFLVFEAAGVEWAVVECGLGGRLDSTNVVHGEVGLVTSIAREHVAVLGSRLAGIAREKGGILKPRSTLVTGVPVDPALGDDDPGAALDAIAWLLGCVVLRPGRIAPTVRERNADLARLALDELGRRGVPVRGELLDAATVEEARLPARQERFAVGGVPVVLDTAHVPASVDLLLSELVSDPALQGPCTAVVALGKDKDAAGVLKALARRADRAVGTTVASGPLARAESLAEHAAAAGLGAETAPDPRAAFARALELTPPGGWVLVLGSFYLAGALRPHFRRSTDTPDT